MTIVQVGGERRRLPRGVTALPPETVATIQRQRLFEAICETVANEGYGAASVASVVERAGVSRATFYAHFRNREECFLAAYADASERLMTAIEIAAGNPSHEWLERITRGMGAYLTFLSNHPAAARAFLLEVQAAGHRAAELRRHVHRRFVDLLRGINAQIQQANPDAPVIGDHALVAIVGAVNELITTEMERGQTNLLDLLPMVLEVELALLGVQR